MEKWYSEERKSTTKIKLVTNFQAEEAETAVLKRIEKLEMQIDDNSYGTITTLGKGIGDWSFRFRFEISGNDIVVSGEWAGEPAFNPADPNIFTYHWSQIRKESEGIGSPKYEVLKAVAESINHTSIFYNR